MKFLKTINRGDNGDELEEGKGKREKEEEERGWIRIHGGVCEMVRYQ